MKKLFGALLAAAALAACATTGTVFGNSPEAQIVTGANSITASTRVGIVLLKNDKITVQQAKSYRALLETVSQHLDAAAATLQSCRKKTGTTQASIPDPCSATVADDIKLALSVAGEVALTLKTKE